MSSLLQLLDSIHQATHPLTLAELLKLNPDTPKRTLQRWIKQGVELLRDVYLWAYEQSVQAYVTKKREMVEPDPVRFAYRDVIKKTVQDVVNYPHENAIAMIDQQVMHYVAESDQQNVRALIMETLRQLHEGVLARYGIQHAKFLVWKAYKKY